MIGGASRQSGLRFLSPLYTPALCADLGEWPPSAAWGRRREWPFTTIVPLIVVR
jgi:hypothetical protein